MLRPPVPKSLHDCVDDVVIQCAHHLKCSGRPSPKSWQPSKILRAHLSSDSSLKSHVLRLVKRWVLDPRVYWIRVCYAESGLCTLHLEMDNVLVRLALGCSFLYTSCQCSSRQNFLP